jgi:hypothetical protein
LRHPRSSTGSNTTMKKIVNTITGIIMFIVFFFTHGAYR